MTDFLDDDVFKSRLAEAQRKMAEEYSFVESAAWFGTTGLDEATERELPHYLRRELGESVYDSKSLKADDLKYLGIFETSAGLSHFWKFPEGNGEELFAYAEPFESQYCLGWGDKIPPVKNT